MGTDLITRISGCALFRDLDEDCLSALGPELEPIGLAAGEVLLEQGDVGDYMYALIGGRLGVSIRHPDGTETVLDEVAPGEIVGEMALLTGRPRAATVYATADAELVRVSKRGFEEVAERCPGALADYAASIALHFQRTRLAGVLTNLVGELDMAALHDLQAELEWHRLSHGEALFRQGDPADALYFVVNGRLRVAVLSPDGSDERIVGEVGSGDIVGEFAFLAGDAHTATVYAIRETNVVKLTQSAFSSLIERYPQLMIRIARIIIARQRSSVRGLPPQRDRALTLALVPIGQEVQLAGFARRLADVLRDIGAVLLLDSPRFDGMYGKEGAAQTPPDDPSSPILVGWMSEQETRHQYILYVADPTWSYWTRRCLRQADCILIVGRADSDPAPGALEVSMQRAGVRTRRELVLLQPEHARWPTGTAKWLRRRHVGAHHHVRLRKNRDLQRLARRVTGHALGLVLSGGGAKGFGHVGAIHALEDAGFQVDLVGGTSMGALVGGVYALGYDYERMRELAKTFARRQSLFDYTLPLVSFLETKRVTSILKELSEDVQIEDLWLPYFCVSCNLTEGKEVMHREGPLWECMRASLAIPGVFSPVAKDGDLLVDGGAINNFPIDVMRDLCEEGVVIGVNASPARHKVREYEFGPSVSGWRVLWSRVNPFTRPMEVPPILTSLMRTVEVNSIYRVAAIRHLADLVIPLPVGEFGTLDFASYERIIEIGYDTTRQYLEEWRPT